MQQPQGGQDSNAVLLKILTVIRFRDQAKNKLSFWLSDKLDELMFLTLSGRAYTLTTTGATRVASQLPSLRFASDVAAATTGRIVYAGAAAAEGSITTADKMSWTTCVKANTLAQEKRLRPVRSGGRDYYCLIVHPRQRRDLVLDSSYQTIVRSAEKNGEKNPLFTGAIATVDGLVIHSHNKVFNTSGLVSGSKWGAGGLVDCAQALLLGAQAGGLAQLGSMFWREADTNDYQNRPGVGVGRKIGMLKPQFRSIFDANVKQDFSVISVKTAAAG